MSSTKLYDTNICVHIYRFTYFHFHASLYLLFIIKNPKRLSLETLNYKIKNMMKNVKLLLFFISISLLLIAVAEAQDGHEGHSHSRTPKCECSHDHDHENKAGAQKYKIAAVPSVLIAGVIGVLFPLLGKVFPSLRPETPFFFVTKAFAAGVILSTGFMHVLPEAYEMLNSPCLTSEAWDFPFTGFIAMVAAILTLSVDTFATSSFNKSHCNASKTIPADGESGELVVDSAKVQMLRTRVIAQVCCLHV